MVDHVLIAKNQEEKSFDRLLHDRGIISAYYRNRLNVYPATLSYPKKNCAEVPEAPHGMNLSAGFQNVTVVPVKAGGV